MDYSAWEATVPATITDDMLWKLKVHRLALFAVESDVTKLAQDRRTRALSDQLYRALGSICANIAEGYSRGSGKDRARFYEYALGSARESRDWYYGARHVLGEHVVEHRLSLPAQIIRLLLTMIPDQRNRTLKEGSASYLPDDVPFPD